jgi:hypothetical protein
MRLLQRACLPLPPVYIQERAEAFDCMFSMLDRLELGTMLLAVNLMDKFAANTTSNHYPIDWGLVAGIALWDAAKFEEGKDDNRIAKIVHILYWERKGASNLSGRTAQPDDPTCPETIPAAYINQYGHYEIALKTRRNRKAYSKKIAVAEREFLKVIEWDLDVPRSLHFLGSIIVQNQEDSRVKQIAEFFLQVAARTSNLVYYLPSLIANLSHELAVYLIARERMSDVSMTVASAMDSIFIANLELGTLITTTNYPSQEILHAMSLLVMQITFLQPSTCIRQWHACLELMPVIPIRLKQFTLSSLMLAYEKNDSDHEDVLSLAASTYAQAVNHG